MPIVVELSKHQARQLLGQAFRKSVRRQHAFLLSFGVVVLAVGVEMLINPGRTGGLAGFMVGVLGLVLIALPFLHVLKIEQLLGKVVNGTSRWTITEQTLRCEMPEASTEVAWSQIVKVLELRDGYALMTNAGILTALPRSIDALRALLVHRGLLTP